MSKPLVYLVDDNIEFCQLMVVSIENLGLDFKYFSKIEDYIEAVKKLEPSLSLVDLNFGSKDLGFQVIEQVRQDIRSTHPLVVLSGKQDVHSVNYALELGANDYVTKPIDRNYLIAKLSQYMITDEMQEWVAPDVELNDVANEALFQLEVTVTAIDEVGIRFKTPHFIAKGTALHISSHIFKEIWGKEKSPVLTLLHSDPMENASGIYDNYAEISLANEDVTRSIRNWISEKTKTAAA